MINASKAYCKSQHYLKIIKRHNKKEKLKEPHYKIDVATLAEIEKGMNVAIKDGKFKCSCTVPSSEPSATRIKNYISSLGYKINVTPKEELSYRREYYGGMWRDRSYWEEDFSKVTFEILWSK